MSKRPSATEAPSNTEKMTTSMRLPLMLKARLDAAAKSMGRSLTQEIEMRLERSFEQQEIRTDALKIAFGNRLAGIVYATGLVMKVIGPLTRFVSTWGYEKGKPIESGRVISVDQASWEENEVQAGRAARALLELLLPDKVDKESETRRRQLLSLQPSDDLRFKLGEQALNAVIFAIYELRSKPDPSANADWLEAAKLIGPEFLERLKPEAVETDEEQEADDAR